MTEERSEEPKKISYGKFDQQVPNYITDPWEKIVAYVGQLKMSEEIKQEFLDYICEERQKFEED